MNSRPSSAPMPVPGSLLALLREQQTMRAIRKPSAENGDLRMLSEGPWGSIGFHHI